MPVKSRDSGCGSWNVLECDCEAAGVKRLDLYGVWGIDENYRLFCLEFDDDVIERV